MRPSGDMGLLFGDGRLSAPLPPSGIDIVSCAAESPSRTGTVRVAGLTGFVDLVSELGGDAAHLIAACGLTRETLANPDNIIPFGLGARLLHLAAAELGCPHFGMLLGQRQDLALLGPIGFLMQHSPDVRSALANLLRYMHLHVEGANARLVVREGLVEFSYRILIPGVLGAEQVYGVCMANEFRFMQLLCGRDWRPAAVHFCFRAPPDEAPFRSFFGAPVRFDQPASAVVFPEQYLDRRISSADPALGDILQRYVSQIESRHSGDFAGQLRSVIRTLLPTGSCTADRVAGLFAMHRRTLHRLLSADGTTFEQVMDTMRQEIAVQMLEQSDMKLALLADMLGYNELSSFNRAFRRWTGSSPSEWRTLGRRRARMP